MVVVEAYFANSCRLNQSRLLLEHLVSKLEKLGLSPRLFRDTLNKAVIVWIVIAEATMGVRTASRGLLGRAWSR